MSGIYKFGPFQADVFRRELTREGRPIPLTPKVFQTLEILLRNRGRIVSKRELLSTIWPDAHIEEANLTQNISVLRKALDETTSATKFIATFPRKGYRFIGTAEEEAAPPDLSEPVQGPHEDRPRRSFPFLWIAGFALLPITVLAVSRLVRTESLVSALGPLRAVTHLPGRAYQPALSPDGRRLAFVSDQSFSGPLRIEVLDLKESREPRALATDEGDSFSPAWSPDGQRLAYLHSRFSRVTVVIQKLGGPPENLTDILPDSRGVVARQLDWSPDGRFLAVSTKSAADEPFRIELINIAAKRKLVLTSPPELSDGDFQPRFSPDGSKLAFVRQRSVGEMKVYFIPIPGGDPVAVSDNTDPCGDVDWTPDGRSVLFTPEHVESSQLWRIPLGSNGKPLHPVARIDLGHGMLQFAVSRLTGRMVLAHAQPDLNIWRASLAPERGITDWERLIASPGEDSYPVYSPNGQRIAFLSDRSGDQQLWIKESDGRERQMTSGDLKPGMASWTANGDRIIFPSLRRRVLYRIVSNGGEPQEIQVGTVGAHVGVSPDGNWVYLVHRFYIMRAPGVGGSQTEVTDQGGFPLRLSSNGEWIYYARHRYSSEIWGLRTRDRFTKRLTNRLRPGCWGCWSVNGDTLIYVSIDGGDAAHLESLNLATGQTRDLGPLPGRFLPPVAGMLSLSPDGHFLVAVVAEPGKGGIQLVEKTPWSVAPEFSGRSLRDTFAHSAKFEILKEHY